MFQSTLFPHALVLGVGVSACAVDLLCCCFSLYPYLPVAVNGDTNFRHIVPHSCTQRGDQLGLLVKACVKDVSATC